MCGISVTIIDNRQKCEQGSASSVAASVECINTQLLSAWAKSAESRLTNRGPDSQHSLHIHIDASKTATICDRCAVSSAPAVEPSSSTVALFTASVLHLRGSATSVTVQPLVEDSGNILCWNGEVYSIDITTLSTDPAFPSPFPTLSPFENDTRYMLRMLSSLPLDSAGFASSITKLMHSVCGPFAFVFFHRATNSIWYGRDKIGRRSMVACERVQDGHNIVQVASVVIEKEHASEVLHNDAAGLAHENSKWEEVSTTGLWCMDFNQPTASSPFTLHHFPYPHITAVLPSLASLSSPTPIASLPLAVSLACGIQLDQEMPPYKRVNFDEIAPEEQQAREAKINEDAAALSLPAPFNSLPATTQMLYSKLYASMSARVGLLCTPPSASHARIGVLFSGGIDCMVLAALTHRVLPPGEPIDLINVAFRGELKRSALAKYVPDRITAINGWRQLKHMSDRMAKEAAASTSSSSSSSAAATTPRQWNLIQVDVTLHMLQTHRTHILKLLAPNASIMDFNIASILWFGTRGRGRLHTETAAESDAAEARDAQGNPSHVDATSSSGVELIESRFSRLGTTPDLVSAGDADASSADGSKSNKRKNKGKELPPEVLAKLNIKPMKKPLADQQVEATAEQPTTASASPPSASPADDVSEPSESPVAAVGSEEGGAAPPLTKSERRALKNRDRKMIRKHFKQAAREKHEEEMEDILPDADDFLTQEEENAERIEEENPSSEAFYTSHAKVLLIGIGADELLAGYGRHRTTFAKGGVAALAAELQKDFTRLWHRNLGRDDRIVSDGQREARHPFLDESFLSFVHSVPLSSLCDLSLPPGVGDKRALRQIAHALGIEAASRLVKRAMQFGSRIANKKVAGYVAMDSSIVLRDIVNPFFLRSIASAASAASSSSSSTPYDATKPKDGIDKRKQKALGKPGFQ